jgi:hypothetical protein
MILWTSLAFSHMGNGDVYMMYIMKLDTYVTAFAITDNVG